MTPALWWKNFGMGLEIDAAGAFIYNAILHLHKLPHLSNSTDSFEFLYSLSVGIERLQKVTIILLEHRDDEGVEELEESLISHNTMELSNRVDSLVRQELSAVHKEFLSLLSKFYKTHRYGRYSFASVPSINAEKKLLLEFLVKHLSVDVPEDEMLLAIPNTDQIRKFVGKVVKRIVSGLYQIIQQRCYDLNIYTYELRDGSKAMKVFCGERLDFLDEDMIRREMLLYLMNSQRDGKHLDFIGSIEPLGLDAGLAPAYIRALVNDIPEYHEYVAGEIEEAFHDIQDVSTRCELVRLIDSEYLAVGDDCNEE